MIRSGRIMKIIIRGIRIYVSGRIIKIIIRRI